MAEREAAKRRIQVRDAELIVARGRAKVAWFVQQGEGWLHVAQWPDVAAEAVDAGPGTVWEMRYELELVVGTQLMCVRSRPRTEPRRDALAYLVEASRNSARSVLRTYHRVARDGTLVPARAAPGRRR